MKELICIVCPKGCHLKVDEENGYKVTGNACIRGEVYGKKELTNPTRTVTSTAIIKGAHICRVPVKSDTEIPKNMVQQAVLCLNGLSLQAPVYTGDVVCNIAGTDAKFVATRTLLKE